MPRKTTRRLIFVLCAVINCGNLKAEPQDSSIIKTLIGKDLNEAIGISSYGLNVGGWITSGYTFNASHPLDRTNGPVQFNNRANEFDLHQLGLFIEKPVDRQLQAWQFGGRFEFMFGTDTPNTQASGHWDTQLITPKNLRLYDIAFPQAYMEILAPFGNGISAKIGHFYSIIGYESVPSPPNLFVSHSYSMKSSPFTMSGVLLNYPVNDYLTMQAGAVTGPDNLDKHAGAWSITGGFSLENKAHSRGYSFSILDGDVDDTMPSHLTYYSMILHQDLLPDLHYVLQHDYGDQTNAVGTQSAEWYSVVNYLTYDIDTKWSAGLRAEWFHDDDGTRFLTAPGSYYEISVGANWKPVGWFTLRPEIRYDWTDGMKPFDVGSQENQLLLSFDSIIQF